MSKNRKKFVFEKDDCHPRFSKKYKEVCLHIAEIFKKGNLKKVVSFMAPLTNSWEGSLTELYLHPGDDFDDEDHDKFCKLVEEYPWEEFGICKPRGIINKDTQAN